MENKLQNTFGYNVIYVYTIPDNAHKGRVKIGETTYKMDKFDIFNSETKRNEDIEKVVRERIKQQTQTADIEYELLHYELAITKTKNKTVFHDNDVHTVLKRSGYEKKANVKGASEWFEISKDIAVKAINAVKLGKNAIDGSKLSETPIEFPFRDSQQEAIDKTKKHYKDKSKNKGTISFLWNAKMRFGKTSAAMQVAKEMNFAKTLIITHRPAVIGGWFDDFGKIFSDASWKFGAKDKGETIDNLLNGDKNFIYFASIQDLRLSEEVIKDSKSQARGFDKNTEIFETEWDFLIVDEAHEGTQSSLGNILDEKIKRRFTLYLSGTPFNLLEKRETDEIYTWDYVMEQEAKCNWEEKHPDEPNPYATLPKLSIFTWELNKYIEQPDYCNIEDKAFNFKEFFRVDEESGEFFHKEHIIKFLDIISKESDSQFPYSTEEYRSYIRHSLWLLPGVKEAEALKKLLENHSVFQYFGIANVAGNNGLEDNNALRTAEETIKNSEYSITLTCGKLTTGVNIPQWTAVFMLSNTSSATTYLQTAFRCQTPYSKNGMMKTNCFVFDFAPDRTLTIIATAAELRTKAGETNTDSQKDYMGKFLNFCPVISATNGRMENFDVERMLRELKKAAIENVVINGFDDAKVYNDNLLKLDGVDLKDFAELQEIIGKSKQIEKTNKIDINKQGFNEEEIEKAEQAEKKPPKERTAAEEELIKKKKELYDQKRTMISILRGISIRIPLLIFGANVSIKEKITPQRFTELVDEVSWKEFMPKGVDKEMFTKFLKYYDEEIFIGAGENIRKKIAASDKLYPFERIEMLTEIFATFKNPDKETVLTPWRVVNMHISDTLGGNNFNVRDEINLPVWEDSHNDIWDNENIKILEINSKSGLYPLLVADNLYVRELKRQNIIQNGIKEKEHYDRIWRKIIAENIFVVCKTPMAVSITQKTLAGFTGAKVNAICIENLTDKMRNDKNFNFLQEANKRFNTGEKDMKFDVVIGNPPYQELDGGSGNGISAIPVYHLFINQAKKLLPCYLSMIIPARWYAGGKGLDTFREEMLNDRCIRKMIDYPKSRECFQSVDIAGGICYFLWDRDNAGDCEFTSIIDDYQSKSNRRLNEFDIFIRDNFGIEIIRKIQMLQEPKMSDVVFSRNTFGFVSSDRGEQNPFDNAIKLFSSEGTGYVRINDVKKNEDIVDNYKISIGKLNPDRAGVNNASDGKMNVITKIRILKPNEIVTESYLILAAFHNLSDTKNCKAFFYTKFVRYLIYLSISSMNITKENFSFVPLQDFTANSDIDWSKSVKEINEQLYNKYDLNEEERNWIEAKIRVME